MVNLWFEKKILLGNIFVIFIKKLNVELGK